MKLDGRKIEGLNEEFIVIPRKDKDIVLRARAIPGYEEFEQMVQLPKPPIKMMPKGKKVSDFENPRYKAGVQDYAMKRTHWLILKSLEATDNLEWETVIMGDPDTWSNFEKEMRDSGFSEVELMKIIQMVMAANGLDETKLEKAREDFLLSQEKQPEESSSQVVEQENMQFGELVNASI